MTDRLPTVFDHFLFFFKTKNAQSQVLNRDTASKSTFESALHRHFYLNSRMQAVPLELEGFSCEAIKCLNLSEDHELWERSLFLLKLSFQQRNVIQVNT